MLSRLKFDLTELANEMLDQIPAEVFASTSTTFLDPAIGGGQFIRAINDRLRKYGHSDENIARRVFGFEANEMRLNFAADKNKLIGTFEALDFLEEDMSKKFDVVIGNPPYQSGKGEKGGARSLWRKFIKKSFENISENGYVAIVCPGFPYNSNDLGHFFKNNTPVYLNNDVTSHFEGIGSEIKSWIVKQGKHQKDFYVDGKVWTWSNDTDPTVNPVITRIFQKAFDNQSTFECKQDRGYSSTQLKNDPNDYFEQPQGDSIYPIRHASTVKTCYVKQPTECHTKRKVMMTFSGYPAFEYFDETTPMSSCYQMSGYILVKDNHEADSIISLYSLKLYKFLSQGIRSAGMRSVTNYSLPKLDLSKTWTDKELYKHFGLTQEEIDYIEANS